MLKAAHAQSASQPWRPPPSTSCGCEKSLRTIRTRQLPLGSALVALVVLAADLFPTRFPPALAAVAGAQAPPLPVPRVAEVRTMRRPDRRRRRGRDSGLQAEFLSSRRPSAVDGNDGDLRRRALLLSIPRGGSEVTGDAVGSALCRSRAVDAYAILTLIGGVVASLVAARDGCSGGDGGALYGDVATSPEGSEEEERVLGCIAMRAWGIICLGWGITLVLAGRGGESAASVERAIAWGHVPLLLFLSKNYLGGKFGRAGIRTGWLVVLVAATAFCVISVLANLWRPRATVAALTVLLGTVSALFYISPTWAANLVLGVDLSHNGKARALVCAEHQYLLLWSIMNAAVLFDTDLDKSLGYTALIHAATTAELTFLRKHHEDFGTGPIIGLLCVAFTSWSSVYLLRRKLSP